MSDRSSDLEAEIIRLAYSTALDPSNLHRLLALIETQASREIDGAISDRDDASGSDLGAPNLEEDDGPDAEARAFRRIQRIEVHLKHAADLLDARGKRTQDWQASRRSVMGDPHPAALLDTSGTVLIANAAAQRHLGLTDGKALPLREGPGHPFTAAALADLRQGCETLDRATIGALMATVPVGDPDVSDGAVLHMALMRVSDEKDRPLGRLNVVSVDWDDAVAERFRASLGLSQAELAVTRAVVTGQSLQALAEARGRKLSTVRNQLKRVYLRTGVGSQVQLASLYSGYAQLARLTSGALKEDLTPIRSAGLRSETIRYAPERTVEFDMVGPQDGDPVLFFHALVIGHTITPEIERALQRRNIRLIMPWRPGWANSSPHAGQPIDYGLFARDLAERLDRDRIGDIPALADNLGGIHALATARHLRQDDGRPRLSSLTWFSPALPVRRLRDMRHLSPSMRSYFMLGRYARPLLDAYVRFAFAKMDAGFDEEHIRSVFQDSPRDLALLDRPGMIERLRHDTERCRGETIEPYVEDLGLEISPFTHLEDATDLPVHALIGDEHLATGEAWPRALAAAHPHFTYEMVPKAGSLFYLERPDPVFRALRERIIERADW